MIYHVLQENGIRLHTLISSEFEFKQARLSKVFYGFDASRTYTKADFRSFNGDTELRRQVKLSKNMFGYCTPLSLETNGTIFSGKRLQASEKYGPIKKFISVFAKRVALTAQPSLCQLCECTGNNDGTAKMECSPCDYPLPITVDFVSVSKNLSQLKLKRV